MTEILREIEQRRALRGLKEDPVPDAVAGRLLTAATYAPSCANRQPWRLMAVDRQAALVNIHEALTGGNYWARKAPLVVIVATKLDLDAQLSDGRDYALYDCGLAAMNLMLQAAREGLVAHPMAGFDPLKVKASFGIPAEYIIINLIAVGYPGGAEGLSEKHAAAEGSKRSRKPEADVICRNAWAFP